MINTIIVTGCCGFIGSNIIALLSEKGYNVIGIDNLSGPLSAKRLETIKDLPNFIFSFSDILSKEAIEQHFAENKVGAVIHLAAKAGVRNSIQNPYEYYDVNVIGSLNLLELIKEYNVPKLVFASTSSAYAGCESPFKESFNTDRVLSPYAASKKAIEILAYTYHHLYDIDVSILRYFTVYGPFGRPDMSPYIFTDAVIKGKHIKVFGDGTQRRDFTYVTDIAEGTIKALKYVGYEIFNLGKGDHPTTINEMITLIEKYSNKKAKIIYEESDSADMFETSASIEKAKEELGWEPKVFFEDGLKETVEWHLNKE